MQQLDQVVFVVIKLKICLQNKTEIYWYKSKSIDKHIGLNLFFECNILFTFLKKSLVIQASLTESNAFLFRNARGYLS